MDWGLLMFYMEAGGLIMWVIAFLSLLGVALVVERAVFFASRARDPFILETPEGLDGEARRAAAERKIRSVLFEWERNVSFLEVIIRVAPMLGLLGTVLGMVQMFQALADGGAVTAVAVTKGIREALFTTVAGLSCAIPLMLAHGLLVSRIEKQEERLSLLAGLAEDEHDRASDAA